MLQQALTLLALVACHHTVHAQEVEFGNEESPHWWSLLLVAFVSLIAGYGVYTSASCLFEWICENRQRQEYRGSGEHIVGTVVEHLKTVEKTHQSSEGGDSSHAAYKVIVKYQAHQNENVATVTKVFTSEAAYHLVQGAGMKVDMITLAKKTGDVRSAVLRASVEQDVPLCTVICGMLWIPLWGITPWVMVYHHHWVYGFDGSAISALLFHIVWTVFAWVVPVLYAYRIQKLHFEKIRREHSGEVDWSHNDTDAGVA